MCIFDARPWRRGGLHKGGNSPEGPKGADGARTSVYWRRSLSRGKNSEIFTPQTQIHTDGTERFYSPGGAVVVGVGVGVTALIGAIAGRYRAACELARCSSCCGRSLCALFVCALCVRGAAARRGTEQLGSDSCRRSACGCRAQEPCAVCARRGWDAAARCARASAAWHVRVRTATLDVTTTALARCWQAASTEAWRPRPRPRMWHRGHAECARAAMGDHHARAAVPQAQQL